ncbi:MAG: response regulator [Leptolyngbya sp. SIO3F4]|nr:response regulator [Leptolyngbya sp. SIO3F4]
MTAERHDILFVDDEGDVLHGIRRLLHSTDRFTLHFATSVAAALRTARMVGVDVIVSDVNMPEQDGLDLLRAMAGDAALRDIPVIMLTGNAETTLKREALDLGALDLLNKPATREDLIARISSALRLRQYQAELRRQNERLEQRVEERTRELARARTELIWRLPRAGRASDPDEGRAARIATLTEALALANGVAADDARRMGQASVLRDIGRPDGVEDEPADAYCQRTHDLIMAPAPNAAPYPPPLLRIAAEIALDHCERWDGAGGPGGKRETDIAHAARLVTTAIALDAALAEVRDDYAQAVQIIKRESGGRLDPSIVLSLDADANRIRAALSPEPQVFESRGLGVWRRAS